jgi:hypothetical protein
MSDDNVQKEKIRNARRYKLLLYSFIVVLGAALAQLVNMGISYKLTSVLNILVVFAVGGVIVILLSSKNWWIDPRQSRKQVSFGIKAVPVAIGTGIALSIYVALSPHIQSIILSITLGAVAFVTLTVMNLIDGENRA